jgi:hypothetical protein
VLVLWLLGAAVVVALWVQLLAAVLDCLPKQAVAVAVPVGWRTKTTSPLFPALLTQWLLVQAVLQVLVQ